ncbi:hypothetical protein R84981_001124 [Carnimonas sp. R-84981]|uniref:hypothetical protein n=1 Tax=Carnimonas bestiolae TaxID=3402172 RepID=UPI003EDB844A
MISLIMTAVKGLLPRLIRDLPWVICAFLAAGMYWQGHKADARATQIEQMKKETAISEAQWQSRMRDVELKRQALADSVESHYLQEEQHGTDTTERTISYLRRGTLKLRRQLAARDATNRLIAAQHSSTARDHGQTPSGLREQDAEFLIRFADTADSRTRQLSACQTYLDGLSR